MNPTTDQTEVELRQWMTMCFQLTGADESHRHVFERMFRTGVDEFRRYNNVDTVTDHVTLMEPDEPEMGTFREAVESGTSEIFGYYLAMRSAQHGEAFATLFANECSRIHDLERPSKSAYSQLYFSSPKTGVNLAWADAHDTCLRLGHSVEYAKLCANWLLELDFSIARAHEVTAKFFKDFNVGRERGYSELRAREFAEYQGPKWESRPEPIAEVFSRIVEEQTRDGRSLMQAEWFADYYADCFDADGMLKLSDEEEFRDYAIIRAEANFRFRENQDGDKGQFVTLFESIAEKTAMGSEQTQAARFDEVERTLRESYLLSELDSSTSRRGWLLKETLPASGTQKP
jgi:hypothetical protein